MRLDYLWLPHLPLQIARTVFPDLSGPRLIALDERVVDADEPCLSSGVRLGMALREARELIPTAQVLTANPTRETEMAERAFEILERLSDGLELAFSPSSSPAQSSSSPSTKAPSGSPVTPQPGAPPTLPPSPLSGIEGAWFVPAGPLSEQRLAAALVDGIATALGLKAQVAIAPGKFIARIAAQRTVRDGVEIIPEDNGAAYLAPLPLTLLPLSPQTVDRLRLLNIHTIGQLSQIPAASLQRRFGQEGLIAHRLARGDDDTPLHPRRPPAVLTAGCTFEDPIEDRTTLLAAAQDLLTRLTDQLQERNETFRTLRLRVYWEEGSDEHRANLRLPTNDPGRVLPVLRTLIEGLDLPGPASSLSLRL